MKIKIIFLTVLLNYSYNLVSQQLSLKVDYAQAIIDKRYTKTEDPKLLKNVTYELVSNNYASKFKLKKELLNDETRNNELFIAKYGGNSIRYVNLKTKEKLYSFETLLNKPVLVKDSFKKN